MQRRDFLKRQILAALGGAGLYSQFGSLRLLQAAAMDAPAVAKGGSYKALVCLYLDGGNDNVNTVIPRDAAGHAQYTAVRPGLALPSSALTAATYLDPVTPQPAGRAYALHPDAPELRNLFASGHCALVANVGPLLEPTTRVSYQGGTVALPPQLFSHSDQRTFWQTSRPDSTQKIGWGGRIADLLQSQNANPQLSMNLSLGGHNVFQTGAQVQPYSLSERGPELRHGYYGDYNAPRRAAIDALLGLSQAHVLERATAGVQRRSLDLYDLVTTALDSVPALATPTPALPPGYESATRAFERVVGDLRMVGRLIAAHGALGQQRQVFFVPMGGFDFHDRLLVEQRALLRALSLALDMFRSITVELGLEAQVTTFTASDFGRTMTANGDGTDHGWGGEHFVIGGAVNGREIYGELPALIAGGDNDAGWGQIIPKLAVDQYVATLARWFGVSEAGIDLILPALAGPSPRFGPATGGFVGTHRDLGFMQPA